MVHRVMVIDLGKCVGCNACAAACMMENLNRPIYYEEPPIRKIMEMVGGEEKPKSIIEELLWMRTRVVRIYNRDSNLKESI